MIAEQVEIDPCDCLRLFYWISSVCSLTVCEITLTQTRPESTQSLGLRLRVQLTDVFTHARSHVFLKKKKAHRPIMSSFFLPAKHSVKDRGRKGKIQRGRKVSLLYLRWVLVTRYSLSLIQEFNIRFFSHPERQGEAEGG